MPISIVVALIALLAVVVISILIFKPEWREGIIEFFTDVIDSFGDD